MNWLHQARMFRPTELWQWLCAGFAVLMAVFLLSFVLTGATDLQQLRAMGQDSRAQILQVLDRDEHGVPTRVLAQGGLLPRPFTLDQLDGSIVGEEVLVREIPGELVWSQTKFRHASDLTIALVYFFLPMALGFLPIFVANLREERRPTTEMYWGNRPQP